MVDQGPCACHTPPVSPGSERREPPDWAWTDEDRSLAERLLRARLLTREQLANALRAGRGTRQSLGDLLVAQGLLDKDENTGTLGDHPRTERLPPIPTRPGTTAPRTRAAPAVDPSTAREHKLVEIGPYVIEAEIGRGGMGVVYRGFDRALRRPVAIKMLRDLDMATGDDLRRFEREAQAIANLSHPGIVAVHAVGQHSGRPYIVMELVAGESLETLLRRQALSPRRVAELVHAVALALEHAHEKGVVHRDVKPGNVMVDEQGRPRLMDFGLARRATTDEAMTNTGAVVGTPAYMAPEQARGDREAQGPRTDVYGLGGLLYRALAGRPPFEAPSIQLLSVKVLNEDPPPLRKIKPGVHADLETITLRCLEKEPERRYGSAREVALELGRFLANEPIEARPTGAATRFLLHARRNKKLTAALAALVLSLGGSLAFAGHSLAREARRKRVHELVGTAHAEAQAKQLQAALDHLNEALALDPSFRVAWSDRAGVRVELNDVRGGLDDLEHALALDPDDAALWRMRGSVRYAHGDPKGAISDETHVLERNPRDVVAFEARARARQLVSDWKGAIEDLSRLLELAPERGDVWALRGRIRREVGDIDAAIEDFTKAIELSPKQAEGWAGRAEARRAKGDLAGYREDIVKLREINAGGGSSGMDSLRLAKDRHARAGEQVTESDHHAQLGLDRFKEHDLAGARAELLKALELDPKNVDALMNLGAISMTQGVLTEAHEAFDKALAIDPSHPNAWAGRAAVRLGEGDPEGAVADFSRAIDLEPDQPAYWMNRAEARKRKNDLKGAEEDATKAVELDPDCATAWLSRGDTRSRRGDRAGAIKDLERFLGLAPDSPSAVDVRKLLESYGRR